MRLIDSDYLSEELRKSTALLNGNTLVPVNLLLALIEKMPTAYDVDKVIRQVNSIGKAYCDSVKCDKNCEDCEHGCIMRAITEKARAGGMNG